MNKEEQLRKQLDIPDDAKILHITPKKRFLCFVIKKFGINLRKIA